MRIRVLGSAAGGDFPQWNCSCRNCASVREGRAGFTALTQSQLAISVDDRSWHLLNGSPDLRAQLLKYPDMLPHPESPRLSPIQSMTITNADIDHTLGLLLLRESAKLRVWSAPYVREALLEGNAYFQMLRQFEGQCDWRAVEAEQQFEMQEGLRARVIDLKGQPPFWAKTKFPPRDLSVMGLVLENAAGMRLGYFPCVAQITPRLIELMSSCAMIFFDGTFWTDDEIQKIKGGTRSGKDMGHVAMSESIEALRDLPRETQKFFIHINNTNPALDENGPQHARLSQAGWRLAQDGMEFLL